MTVSLPIHPPLPPFQICLFLFLTLDNVHYVLSFNFNITSKFTSSLNCVVSFNNIVVNYCAELDNRTDDWSKEWVVGDLSYIFAIIFYCIVLNLKNIFSSLFLKCTNDKASLLALWRVIKLLKCQFSAPWSFLLCVYWVLHLFPTKIMSNTHVMGEET